MSEPIRTRQEPLFIESLEDAMEAVAFACGGKKAFACALRPDLADEPDKAHRWFLDCLNLDRRAEFHVDHLKRACVEARVHGCHALKHWFDTTTGYEPGVVAPPKTERQVIAARRRALAEQLATLADDEAALDRRDDAQHLRSLKSR